MILIFAVCILIIGIIIYYITEKIRRDKAAIKIINGHGYSYNNIDTGYGYGYNNGKSNSYVETSEL